ncbi:M20/M25/M40 family metallo-hydrolase [Sphingobium sp. 3R8]|uniref:M20/M25/M40 family metallo-hydrolase n=1 Tax=Sphingobium sp. 3R8 TaxID=2874921 RepID=UPI001CCF9768|nr:M20/M25/M40 family metallo-hydrolase [Sphingobium sp. 3R8]MBZ9646735.1 M20/M25/M40 family metallo-hydrolase [Sphingobium sp. 3R8]
MKKIYADEAADQLSNSLSRWALALLVIACGVALGIMANRLPAPKSATAPTTDFSADRAMQHVRAIATRPHPTGSPEIDDTRRYLMKQTQALGLNPLLRTQTAISARRYFNDVAPAGRMQNIVAEYRGIDPTLPAVLLMAHYDTAALSPGAGDDTSGVAVALEVARALKAAGALRRSVIFLFADGEEAGLLGSTAFFASDPLRRRIGLVINLEARGDSGRALMFQTSAGNSRLIDVYRQAVPSPAADSLLVTIYKHMPNDTDLTAALDKGLAGLNFAFVGHQMAYHTALSTPDRLNAGSIQHMGDQVLPAVRLFAQADSLDRAQDDSIFSDLFGLFLIAYPSWLGWVLAIATIGATFAMTGVALARRTIDWRDMLAGAGGLLALLLGIATMLMLALRLAALIVRDLSTPYALIGQFGALLAATALLGISFGLLLLGVAMTARPKVAALGLGIAGLATGFLGSFSAIPLIVGGGAALLVFANMRRPVSLNGWFAGAMTLVGLLALAFQIMLPNGAHILLWPLLLFALPLAMLLFAPISSLQPLGLLAMTAPAILIAGLMARAGYDFFLMIGVSLPAIVTPFILLTLLALAPLLWSSRNLLRVASIGSVAGLGLFVAAAIDARTPTADNPDMVEAFYIADIDSARANWVSARLDRAGWVRRTLSQDGGVPRLGSIAPIAKDDHWIAPAKPAAFARPVLRLTATSAGNGHRINLVAANRNGGRFMRLFFKPSVELRNLRLMDQPVSGPIKAGDWSSMTFHASGADPVHVSMDAAGPGQMDIQLIEVRDQWPEGAKTIPLPPHSIPYRRAGNSLILARAALRW